MAEQGSYSPEEVSKILKIAKGTVYEIIKRGELPAYRIGKKIRVNQEDLDEYQQASNIAGKKELESSLNSSQGLIICGQDIILDILTRYMERKAPALRTLRSYVGSIDGLSALYKKQVNVTAAHLWDPDTNDYNTPYIKKLLPGQKLVVINLAYRYQGFYVKEGNPKKIFDWQDLLRPDITFINREAGCGARVLLDQKLMATCLDSKGIRGYDKVEYSHAAVASAVSRGVADVGLGIEKAALQVPGLSFISMQKERYDLVLYRQDLTKANFKLLLEIIRSKEFKDEVKGLGGYDVDQMGEILAEI